MQEQKSQPRGYFEDPLTGTRYRFEQGDIHVEEKDKAPQVYPLSKIGSESRRNHSRFYLKFLKKNNAHLSISPQGTLITSKSDRIQEVDLNVSISKGQLWWELFVPHTTLFLTVGLKDKNQAVFHAFDFCLKYSAKLQFKINLDNLTFKTWINGIQSRTKPTQNLQKDIEWVPFIRIKQTGTNISINSIIPDPQGDLSQFYPFFEKGKIQLPEQVKQNDFILDKQSSGINFTLIANNKILLSNSNSIKLIQRNCETKQFAFENLVVRGHRGQSLVYLVRINSRQKQILKKVQQIYGIKILGAILVQNQAQWLVKTQEQWSQWFKNIFSRLQSLIIQEQSFSTLVSSVYRWALQKLQILRGYLVQQVKIGSWNSFDSQLIEYIDRNTFKQRRITLQKLIDSSFYTNSISQYSFTQPISSLKSSNNYLFVELQGNKFSIFCTRKNLFKIGDFILSKAIKKQHQFGQYKKQAQDLKQNDFTKPSIYKILKNCLKYADKVKPPEKLLKQLEEKKNIQKQKSKKKQEKKDELIPDKQLQNTLIQMGFEIKIAKKALIQCKNASLQSALDLITSGTLKVEPQITPLSSKPRNKQWTCQNCTLVNQKNSTICAACEVPYNPIQIQQQNEVSQKEIVQIEQQIKSQKIDEAIKGLYPCQTNIGCLPLLIAGVFNSKIRFRLFCLNPKSFSSVYEKGDAFGNLINNTLNEHSSQITSTAIEELVFTYYDQEELKDKRFLWIPIEDIDFHTKQQITSIQYSISRDARQIVQIKAVIHLKSCVKSLTFALNTSKAFQEKQRCFTLLKEQDGQIEEKPLQDLQEPVKSQFYNNCSTVNLSANTDAQFEAILQVKHRNQNYTEIEQIQAVEQLPQRSQYLQLNILKGTNSGHYPEISLMISENSSSKIQSLANTIILGSFQNVSFSFEGMGLTLNSGKDDEVIGYCYFSNDYHLSPLKKYKFKLLGKHQNQIFKFEPVIAKYIILVFEASKDKLIELSHANIYGKSVGISIKSEIVTLQIPQEQRKIKLVGGDSEQLSYSLQAQIVNDNFDLSLLKMISLEQAKKYNCELKIKIIPNSFDCKKLTLEDIEINGYLVSIVRVQKHHRLVCLKEEQRIESYDKLLDKYLSTFDHSLIESLIKKENYKYIYLIKSKTLKQFFFNYLINTPFDRRKKHCHQIFISSFAEELKQHKEELKIKEIIMEGINHPNLTAFGLELLFQLNQITQSLSVSNIIEMTQKSVCKIKQWKENTSKNFNIYAQKTIFSSFIHDLSQENQNSSIHKHKNLSQTVYLRKYKFGREYTVDLYSTHRLTNLDLNFESAKTKNKLIITIKWHNNNGQIVGSLHKYIDHSIWNQLTESIKGREKWRTYSIDLSGEFIQTRYLSISCSFTLMPLNGSKSEVQNLYEKDIVPVVYGQYIGQNNHALPIISNFLKKKSYVSKTLNYKKYVLDNHRQWYIYESQQLIAQEGNIAQLQKNLASDANKAKWIAAKMMNPSKQSLDFDLTLFCYAAKSIVNTQLHLSEEISQQWIEITVKVLCQNENKKIQDIAIQAIRSLANQRPEIYKNILQSEITTRKNLVSLLPKNPLDIAEERQFIYQTLCKRESKFKDNYFTNCLALINSVNIQDKKDFQKIGAYLVKQLNKNRQYDAVCDLSEVIGWVEGVRETFQRISDKNKKKTLSSTASFSDLLQFLNLKVSKQNIGVDIWILLEQLAAKEPQFSELKEVIDHIMNKIVDYGQQDDQNDNSLENFESLIATISSLTPDNKTCQKLIKTYFALQGRDTILSYFFSIKFVSSVSSKLSLLNQVNGELLLLKDKRSGNKDDRIAFLVKILSFIYEKDDFSVSIPQQLNKNLSQNLSFFLTGQLNFGGVEGCQYLNQKLISKLALAYYVSLGFGAQVVLPSQVLARFTYWYILNLSSNAITTETNNSKKFRQIHLNVSKLIFANFKGKQTSKIIAETIKDILAQSKNSCQNKLISYLYQAKVYSFIGSVLKLGNQKGEFASALLDQQGIYGSLLREINQITSFETTQNPILSEKQIVNDLVILEEEKPKSWLIFKDGAKNHVYKINYSSENKQFQTLTCESSNSFWLSQIIIGFQFNQNILAPKDIVVEIGDSLNSMKTIGKLDYVPLQSYLSHSVKIYSINFHRNITKKWTSSKHQNCRFVRITFKSPYSNVLFDSLEGPSNNILQQSLISFLSVNGYSQNGATPPPKQVKSLVQCLQFLSNSHFKNVLELLMQKKDNQDLFENSLINLSYLMGNQNYGLSIHKFLMRICEINSEIGNKMLNKYLQFKNSFLSAKIVSEIVSSSILLSGSRLITFFNFIVDSIKSNLHTQLVPFITKFNGLVSSLSKMWSFGENKLKISLQISEDLIKGILKISKSNITFKKFLTIILSYQGSISFVGFDHLSIFEQLYYSKNEEDILLMASLIVRNPLCTSWFQDKKFLPIIFEEILIRIRQNSDSKKISLWIKFLTILCQNVKLKAEISKSKYDLKIFEILVGMQGEKLIGLTQNKSLRENLVNFIGKASLGSENQKLIGALLKDSLNSIALESSQLFIAEIFLPLLNSYSKTIVNLLPFNSIENKLQYDLSNFKIQKPQEISDKKPNSNFKLPSAILSNEDKQHLFKQLIVSDHKWGAFKLITNHGKFPSYRNSESIGKQIANRKKSILLVIQSTSKIIVFFNRTNNYDNSLTWSKGSFILQVQNSSVTSSAISNNNQQKSKKIVIKTHLPQILQFSSSKGKIAQINFDGYTSSVYYKNSLKSGNQLLQSQDIESAEYWSLDYQSVDSYQAVFANQQIFAQKLLSQLDNYSFFKPSLVADESLTLLREQQLHQFPTSITIHELKRHIEIFGLSIPDEDLKDIKIKSTNFSQIKDTDTLESLIKRSQNNDYLLQLLIQINNLPQLKQIKDSISNQFLPRKGILRYFEQNDGIKSMIKVIKKSISEWKNQSRKQKWVQYALQLQNFSVFPHFFSAYLKDKNTFKLLLDLLSGLPDKQTDNNKWDELQIISSQNLLKIVSDILSMDKTNQFREYAIKNGFISTILDRLRILTGLFKRKYETQIVVEQEVVSSPSKQPVEDDGTKKIKKKKGVGYSQQTNSNTKWMKGENLTNIKKQFENVQTILTLIENFLNTKSWIFPKQVVSELLQSSLLPYIQDCLRAGTLLEISKHPEKFKSVLRLVKSLIKQDKLLVCLLPLPSNYQPSQPQSIQSLLKNLFSISKIFLSCLSQNLSTEDKLSQELANDIIETYTLVQDAIEEMDQNNSSGQTDLTNVLTLSLDKKYRELMKDLRFDYIDMKQSATKIKHHYASYFSANYTPNHNKMIRLAQELADISTALPHEHTNAVYVRCDKDRVDFMQALIMGSNGTPYGHGAFLFDIYFEDTYPTGPPKVNLTTTGHGKIRFNPNLYSCGKVCLSLLGTWRGSASQNWDAKVSTLLQVLLSIQAIIMSEEVYFNEPGFENEQGTQEGQKKNQAYSNIVRYGNVKFAMLENIKNPPKGFEAVIRRHFYLKKDEILQQCRKWLKYAEKRPANYIGLVNDHNISWAAQFKKSKTQYKQMLQKAINELQQQLNKLPPPNIADIKAKHTVKKEKKKRQDPNKNLKALEGVGLQQIDVAYEKNKIEGKQLDVNDEKVRDRWSRYIGAMGIDAVSKQSKADILIYGLSPFGLEVVKNIVLSGCRKLTLCDDQVVRREDLSGGFFYQEEDVGKKRVDSVLQKIRQLNPYVKTDSIQRIQLTQAVISTYSLAFISQLALPEQKALATLCRQSKVKFISADCRGAYCRLVNDFGEFTVLDKNGQEPVEVMLGGIEISEKGLVTLLEGAKHPFEDGQVVLINHVQGMNHQEIKDKNINGTIHTIKVINYKSFQIGNTSQYDKYIRNGTAKNIKTPVNIKFRPFEDSIDPAETNLAIQPNVEYFDFSKLQNSKLVQRCFITLDAFKIENKRMPEAWSIKDASIFCQIYKKIWEDQITIVEKTFINEFSFTIKGYLPPLCAFFGGLASQQIIKAITQKFKPIHSAIYLQFSQIIPKKDNDSDWSQAQVQNIYKSSNNRNEGFAIVVGNDLANEVKQSKLFMIGAGAIGCQLLKNLAMVGLGTGKQGKIILTDPDHIENSNLNRQFLFREKHISKPKSSTAAASVILMNSQLKGHISALLERVSDNTKEIFNNKFFQSLTVVANALDNVAARRYVDQRCVENKVPLFESGTLGPKGHVQVIVPYQTESYGSQNDPVQQGQIPHCTLKMFPEETLHCIQWARDIFGKKFTLQPKALAKFLEKGFKPQAQDIKNLNESLKMVKKGPQCFEDCIEYAINKFYKYFRDDILQLLYTYPLDAKTKNGQPFWRLPKRPPTPLKFFNPQDLLHCTFVASLAVLLAKIYQIPYPKMFRAQKERLEIGKMASKIVVQQFVPSDEKAKAILKQTTTQEKKGQTEQQKTQVDKQSQQNSDINSKNEEQLHKQLLGEVNGQFHIKSQEFQKDDDANGHIDFIYSMANLRALNYKLDLVDWITTKIKAGRIVPALATTTSCVAGLQVLQICKYLKKLKVEKLRNSYLNLAVPSLQMSEPGEVKKNKITDKLTVTLWDRWEVDCDDKSTFGHVYEELKKKYGLYPKGVLQGMSRIDIAKTENDLKAFLSTPILEKLEKEDEYIDIVVLFTLEEKDDKIIQDLPSVRLTFKK